MMTPFCHEMPPASGTISQQQQQHGVSGYLLVVSVSVFHLPSEDAHTRLFRSRALMCHNESPWVFAYSSLCIIKSHKSSAVGICPSHYRLQVLVRSGLSYSSIETTKGKI